MNTQMDEDLENCEFIAKNTKHNHLPIRSSFPVTSGVSYYEVTPLTDGKMRFGWSAKDAKLSPLKLIGDDEQSIGLELRNGCWIYHNHNDRLKKIKGKYLITNLPPFGQEKVIGCFIDVENRQFKFYINGHELKCPDNIYFSSLSYHATVSLAFDQKCQFNFGQMPFKFCPNDKNYSNVNRTIDYMKRYQLAETAKFCRFFWFKYRVMKNEDNLFYRDLKQGECDALVRKLEHAIEHNHTVRIDNSRFECGRFVQSVIETLNRTLASDHTDLIARFIREGINKQKANDFEKAKLFELLYLYHQLSATTVDTIKFHNIYFITILCFNIFNNFNEYFDITLPQVRKTFLNPKLMIINPGTMIFVFNCLKHIPLDQAKQALLDDSTIWWCAEVFGQVNSISRLYEPSCNFERLEAGWCARWYRDHLTGDDEHHFPSQFTLNPSDKTEHIKLSSDCLSARNDYVEFQSIRSVCSVNSGIYYYETILLTNGKMRIGWATNLTELQKNIIGSGKHSIGFDGSDGTEIYHQWKNFADNSNIFNFTNKPRWSAGDVIGCLINFKKRKFRFYLNGKLVKYKEKLQNGQNKDFVNFVDQPYYAAVSLHLNQHCYVNFGQAPLKYPPKKVLFKTFHQNSINASPILFYSLCLSKCYSFMEVLVKDKVELLFDDLNQRNFDELIEKIKEETDFNVKLENDVDYLRMIQSMINAEGKKLSDNQIDLMANWIDKVIRQCSTEDSLFPDLVFQVLYPMFSLHLTDDTFIQHRNVCIVLASLNTVLEDLKLRVTLYQQVLLYLSEIVTSSNLDDEWLLIFALISLENMELTETDIEKIRTNAKFCKNLQAQSYSTYHSHRNRYNISKSVLNQSEFCTRWFLDHVLKTKFTQEADISNNKTTLNPYDKSANLKLSPDFITARSNRQWQSVRSICFATKVVYYEVTLHTNGPMRIGFANKRSNLSFDPIGTDFNSIAYDGYNQCIWHQNKCIKLLKYKVPIPRWKAGDVVGCLISVDPQSFSFYLNQQLVYVHPLGFFSKIHQYFAAASLHTFQQCQFNFGAIELPPSIDFYTFDSMLNMAFGSITNMVNSIKNSVVLSGGSKLIANNIQITSIAPITTATSNHKDLLSHTPKDSISHN